MSQIARAFNELPSPAERRVALEAILQRCTKAEWRAISKAVKSLDFRCDIIASLPIELVAMVVSYLPMNAPFRYQRVSRNWRQIMSSAVVLGPLASTWASDQEPKLKGTSEAPNMNEFARCASTMERAFRFKTCKPSSMQTYYYPVDEGASRADSIDTPAAFCLDTIALRSGRHVQLINLRSGWKRTFASAGRESISDVALTEDMLAVLHRSGKCFVTDLRSEEAKQSYFRILGHGDVKFKACGRTVAAVTESTSEERDLDVWVWNLDRQKTYSFHIKWAFKECLAHDFVLAEDTNSIIFFVVESSFATDGDEIRRRRLPPVPAHIRSCRFSFDGKPESNWSDGYFLDSHIRRGKDVHLIESIDLRPADYSNRVYVVKIGYGLETEPPRTRPKEQLRPGLMLVYNITEHKFGEIGTIPSIKAGIEAMIWKDTIYTYHWKSGRFRGLSSVNLLDREYKDEDNENRHIGFQKAADGRSHRLLFEDDESDGDEEDYGDEDGDEDEDEDDWTLPSQCADPPMMTGNDRFLALFSRGRYYVFCFDKDVSLPRATEQGGNNACAVSNV